MSCRLRKAYVGAALMLSLSASLGGFASHVAAADVDKYDHITLSEDAPFYESIGGEVKWELPAGDEVVVLTGQKEGFYRVAWGKQRGYMTAEDLAAGSEAGADEDLPEDTFTADQSTGTATVAHSGDGVNFRSEAGYDGEIIDELPDGTVVELRLDEEDTVTDETGAVWWPVRFDGTEGWIAGYYLSAGEDVAADDNTDAESEDADQDSPAFAAGDFVAVSTDDGSGVNVRVDPSADSEKIGELSEEEVVQVVEGPAVDNDGAAWYLITDGDLTGYVTGEWLIAAPEAALPSDEEEAGEQDAVKFAAGDYVEVDSGDGVNLRDDAGTDSKVVATLVEGEIILIVEGPKYDDSGNGWYLVDDGVTRGYADGGLLSAVPADELPDDVPGAEPEQPAAPEAIVFAAGDSVVASSDGDGANVRADAGKAAKLVGTLTDGDVVQVLDAKHDGSGNDWYLIENDDVRGYVAGDLLDASSPAEAPAPAAGPTGSFIYPLANYQFTQAYGCSPYAFEPYYPNLGCNFHNGVDLAAPMYTSIMASDGGTVTFAGWCDCGLGWYVEIDHGNGYSTVYGHMAEMPWVATGAKVNQGDVIGPIGSSGASTGPHTHFMVKQNGSTIDPMSVLP
jgi:murein DD-endopeptidase MepM/ murein hydrolase activator NlpD